MRQSESEREFERERERDHVHIRKRRDIKIELTLRARNIKKAELEKSFSLFRGEKQDVAAWSNFFFLFCFLW